MHVHSTMHENSVATSKVPPIGSNPGENRNG